MLLLRTLSRISRRAARASAVLSISLAAACGGSDKSPAGPDDTNALAGTYALRTVAGRPVPAVILEEGTDKLELLSGALTLNANGSYAGTLTLRLTEGGRVTTETDGGTGTYTATGGSIVMTDSDGERTTATVSGNSISLSDGGVVMVFTR